MESVQAIRGMNDILPEHIHWWQFVEAQLRDLAQQYGYKEIRLPLVEKTQLFKRTIGEVTDVVEKEMYVFEDRNGDSLALRPEGTAGCVRAALQHGLLHNQVQKLWYMGPMYRHERPQKGRYRQFYQFGLEAFGLAGPDIDVELMAFSYRLWQQLGLAENLVLHINSLGSQAARQRYKSILVEYFTQHRHQLDEDSQRRLTSNPLRILDSKNPAMGTLIADAPRLLDHVDEASAQEFQCLLSQLDALHIPYKVSHRLVRGLDYYSKTVFEWGSEDLGAQGTVCAGGRYDDLVALLGGAQTPAVGFSMGLDRIVILLETLFSKKVEPIKPHVYLMTLGQRAAEQALTLAESLRNTVPQLRLHTHLGGGSAKSQFKKADKSGAALGLLLGEDELEKNEIVIKFLRESKEQCTVPLGDVSDYLQHYLLEKDPA